MGNTSLIKKLLLKPGYRAVVLRAPEGYSDLLGELPEGVTFDQQADGIYDWVQLFVRSTAEVETHAPAAMAAVKPGGLLWLTYPKQSSKIKTDINRDRGWQAVVAAGWEGVTQIAVDETWSALRFRPLSEIKVLTRAAYRNKD
ncbi:MAG: hypothetical protein J0L63_15070 [Anaerolineae bacterium]|nr:hypothetical protein [Anaerolineae bacterium]